MASIAYDGAGTLTGAALNYVLSNKLDIATGRRPNLPLIVIVLTDGMKTDNLPVQ